MKAFAALALSGRGRLLWGGLARQLVVHPTTSGPGCFGHPAGQACEVSRGATVNATDGAVTGGTETCKSLCGASQYEMTCMDTSASPDPALGCSVIPIPTPSCCLYYCCPCAD